MELTPREKDKLLLFTAALVAERRLARGVKLNYPEAVAYISAAIMEGARDGRTVADLMSHGATLLGREQEFKDLMLLKEGETFSGQLLSDSQKRILDQLGAVITRNTRRIRLYLASNWPSAPIFAHAMRMLRSP